MSKKSNNTDIKTLPEWLQQLWEENPALARKAEKEHIRRNEILKEAGYLLYVYGPDSCPDWVEGLGDCDEFGCEYCRYRRCLDAIDDEKNG